MPNNKDSFDLDNVIDLEKFRARWQASGAFGNFLGGNFFRKILLPLLLLIIGLKLFIFLCFVYVRPNEYGIKVVRVPVFGARGCIKKFTTPVFILS